MKRNASETIESLAARTPTLTEENLRVIELFGEIDEGRSAEVIYALLSLHASGRHEVLDEATKDDPSLFRAGVSFESIWLYISTPGGSVADAFAIYDIMRMIKKQGTNICTVGIGKIMSAGTLLLSAGTKGQRFVGENARFMLHPISAETGGRLPDLEAEMAEIKLQEERFTNCLVRETKMSKKFIEKLNQKQINIYFNALGAIKYGLADEIL